MKVTLYWRSVPGRPPFPQVKVEGCADPTVELCLRDLLTASLHTPQDDGAKEHLVYAIQHRLKKLADEGVIERCDVPVEWDGGAKKKPNQSPRRQIKKGAK